MGSVSCNGAVLSYEEAGRGDPPIVLIHGGAFCDHTHMAPLFEHFSRAHRVLAPDLRGHGDSQRAGLISNEQFADDVAALCDALGVNHPILIGHSTGGHAALEFAGRHPGRAGAIVLLDIGPLHWPPVLATQTAALADALRSPGGRAVLRAVAEHLLPADEPFAGRDELLARAELASPEVFADLIASDLAWDGRAAAKRCPSSTPTLLLVADKPLLGLDEFSGLCPHASVGRTVGSGHFQQLVVPNQVIAMIERFLEVNELEPARQPAD